MSRSKGKSPSGDESGGSPKGDSPVPITSITTGTSINSGADPKVDKVAKSGSKSVSNGADGPVGDSGESAKPKSRRKKSQTKKSSPGENVAVKYGVEGTESDRGWPLWIVPVPALLGLGLVLFFVWLGNQNPSFPPTAQPLDKIRITMPAWLDRGRFLEEVRYMGELPSTIDPTREEELFHLRAGLGKHPWVRSVEGIDFQGNVLTARIQFRVPVLQVEVDPGQSPGGNTRLVDEAGVLLPVGDFSGLARLRSRVGPPKGPPGQLWGDRQVEGAAALAGWLSRQSPPLRPSIIDGVPGAWRMEIQGHPVFWGAGTETHTIAKLEARLAFLRMALESVSPGLSIDLSEK